MRHRYAVPIAVGCVGLAVASLSLRTGLVRPASADSGEVPLHGADDVPVVVELFTSEGCSSCPPADEVLARFERAQPVSRATVLPLSFHVDYWDDLGWPDPFASHAFTARQQAYAGAGGRMYTPQAVLDGQAELVGSDATGLERAVERAARRVHTAVDATVVPKGGSLEVAVRVGPLPKSSNESRAVVLVALTQAEARVNVLRGENAGRTLRHTAIVRALETAGTVDGRGGESRAVLSVPVGIPLSELRVVAFVQRTNDRGIVGAVSRAVTR